MNILKINVFHEKHIVITVKINTQTQLMYEHISQTYFAINYRYCQNSRHNTISVL
jgi:hypothetical protein